MTVEKIKEKCKDRRAGNLANSIIIRILPILILLIGFFAKEMYSDFKNKLNSNEKLLTEIKEIVIEDKANNKGIQAIQAFKNTEYENKFRLIFKMIHKNNDEISFNIPLQKDTINYLTLK